MAEVSFPVSTVGIVLTFILTDPGIAGSPGAVISNAVSITNCVWFNNRGQRRALTLSQPASATFTYTISSGDSRTPHIEIGYIEVDYGANVFFALSSFTMNVYQHF